MPIHLSLQRQPEALLQASKVNVTGDHLRFGPGRVELRDLYLLELRRTGCTVQIILGRCINSTTTETLTSRNINDVGALAVSAASAPFVQHLEKPATSSHISSSSFAATQSSVPMVESDNGQQGAVGSPMYPAPARAVDQLGPVGYPGSSVDRRTLVHGDIIPHPPSDMLWGGSGMASVTPSQWYHTLVSSPYSYDFALFADGGSPHATTGPFSGHDPMWYAEQ